MKDIIFVMRERHESMVVFPASVPRTAGVEAKACHACQRCLRHFYRVRDMSLLLLSFPAMPCLACRHAAAEAA